MGQENGKEQSVGPVNEEQSIFLKKRERRKPEIIRLYFGEGKTLEQVAKALNISRSEAHREVDKLRREALAGLKKDLRINRKILNCMIDLLAQTDERARIIWNKIEELERDKEVFRTKLNRAYESLRQGANVNIENLSELTEASRAVNAIHERQQAYFNLLRHQSMSKLDIWDRFGLCGKDALDVILTNGVDVEAKLEETRAMLKDLTTLIYQEVTNKEDRQRICSRFAAAIGPKGYLGIDAKPKPISGPVQ